MKLTQNNVTIKLCHRTVNRGDRKGTTYLTIPANASLSDISKFFGEDIVRDEFLKVVNKNAQSLYQDALDDNTGDLMVKRYGQEFMNMFHLSPTMVQLQDALKVAIKSGTFEDVKVLQAMIEDKKRK